MQDEQATLSPLASNSSNWAPAEYKSSCHVASCDAFRTILLMSSSARAHCSLQSSCPLYWRGGLLNAHYYYQGNLSNLQIKGTVALCYSSNHLPNGKELYLTIVFNRTMQTLFFHSSFYGILDFTWLSSFLTTYLYVR